MSAPDRRDDERFAEWVDGCMSSRDRERFEAELRVNARLRADLEAYERTVASVQAALRAPAAEVDLADRVLARLAATQEAAPMLAGPQRRPWLLAMVLVAAMLGVTVWISSWPPTPSGLDVAKVADAAPEAASTPAVAALAPKPADGDRSGQEAGEPEHAGAMRPSVSGAPIAGGGGAGGGGAGGGGAGGGKNVDLRRLVGSGLPVPPETKAEQGVANLGKAEDPREPKPTPTRSFDESFPESPVPVAPAPGVGGPDGKAPGEPKPMAPEAATVTTAVPGGELGDGVPPAARLAMPQPAADDKAGDDQAKRKAVEEHLEGREVAETLARTELVPEIVVTGTVPAARRGRGSPAVGGEPKGPVAGGAAPAGPSAGSPAGPATGGPAGPSSGGPVRPDRLGGSKAADRGAPPATGAKRAADLGSEVEQFLAAQLAAPAKDVRTGNWGATSGSLRLTVLEPPVHTDADTDGGIDAEAAAGERAWLVEGQQHEVAVLVARLSALVRRQQLQMNNGETRLAKPPAPAEETVRDEAAKQVPTAAAGAAGPVRLVLRLRLTPR